MPWWEAILAAIGGVGGAIVIIIATVMRFETENRKKTKIKANYIRLEENV